MTWTRRYHSALEIERCPNRAHSARAENGAGKQTIYCNNKSGCSDTCWNAITTERPWHSEMLQLVASVDHSCLAYRE